VTGRVGVAGWFISSSLARTPISFRVRLIASLTGYAITAFVVAWSLADHGLAPDLSVWDRVGDQVRTGISPYGENYPWGAWFPYAPPWALLFGLVSWLPLAGQALLVFGAELAALRYIAGSWLRVGYFGLFFVTGGEFANGSFNLVLAAGLLAAMRGDGRLATIGALAKLSPVLAIREWRGPLTVLVICLIVTLPWLGLWADWLRLLADASTRSIGYPFPPLPVRAVIAVVVLLAWRSPRAGVLAAFMAIPGLYSYSFVLLYPLLTPSTVSDSHASN
jgi:hypothetical protein